MLLFTLVQRRTHVDTVQTVHSQLKTHLLKSHDEGTWFICHICQKKFCLIGNFKVHMLRHKDVKPYVCDECSKSFCTADGLKRHQQKHSDYKQFCCGSCGVYFKHKETFRTFFLADYEWPVVLMVQGCVCQSAVCLSVLQ